MITKFLRPLLKLLGKDAYCQDGLITVHNHDFMNDPDFRRSYERGVKADGQDYHFQWRVHVALWAAKHASRLEGDFVECGVNRGFLSSAILDSLDWANLKKSYYLLDTFTGPDEQLLSEAERAAGYVERKKEAQEVGFYTTQVETVVSNFKEWDRVHIVQGRIPETLGLVPAKAIAFIHIDLNCSGPEVAALDYFWSRITPGGMVLLDDYAYVGFALSKAGIDRLAAAKGVAVLSLPTGQGLLIKPHSS